MDAFERSPSRLERQNCDLPSNRFDVLRQRSVLENALGGMFRYWLDKIAKGHSKGACQGVKNLERGVPSAALDLREVRLGNSCTVGDHTLRTSPSSQLQDSPAKCSANALCFTHATRNDTGDARK